MEMWRLLHVKNKGGEDAVEFGGVRRLQEYGRCNEVKQLNENIDDWLDVLSQFGAGLEQCPKLLRSMVFAILPKSYEEELLTKPEHCKTYMDIIKWCRQKTAILRTRELADFTRKPPGHAKALRGKQHDDDHSDEESAAPDLGGRPSANIAPTEEIPAWARPRTAALTTRPPPKKPTGTGTDRPASKPKSRAQIPAGLSFVDVGIARPPTTRDLVVVMERGQSVRRSPRYSEMRTRALQTAAR